MDLSEAKVSVIIPAYNAAASIEESAVSVLGQSHKNLELIIVNDGSTDDTAEIVTQLKEKDNRIKLLTIDNSGPANARNRGMELLSPDSEYIMFSDADDILGENAIDYALSAAEKGAQLVLLGFTIVNPDGSERQYFENEEYFTPDTIGNALPRLYAANMLNQVWAKLFSTKLISDNNIRFKDFKWGEDRLFVFDCIQHAQLCAMLPQCRYKYMMHKGESLISRFYDKKAEACCLADKRMHELCLKYSAEDDTLCRYMFAKSIFSCMTNMFSPGCPLDKDGKRAYVKSILDNPRVQERTYFDFGGIDVKILCRVIHTKQVWLNMLAFHFVAFVGKAAPKLFMKLKHKK